jgi:thioredoxin reductase (NADPH)
MLIRTDAVIVGAGPVGLFQIFELGLLGLRAHVVDTLPHIGGQCVELYPDKPIYDIPALPTVSGRELIDRLLEQSQPFSPQFHLEQQVTEVEKQPDGRFVVTTSAGTTFDAGAVIIAGGVGAFAPRRLDLPGLEAFEDRQVFYRVRDRATHVGRDLIVLGGGDSALDWTLDYLTDASSVLLIHRSQDFRAAPASVEKMRAACRELEMQFLEGSVVDFLAQDGVLTQLKVKTRDGGVRSVPADHVLVFFGLSPKLGPIAEWGLSLNRNRIEVDTEKFQTSTPGIFAVGDINVYPGKKKLILSGFHEAALAAFAVAEYLQPGEKISLQYTTTNTQLHKRLGVSVDLTTL